MADGKDGSATSEERVPLLLLLDRDSSESESSSSDTSDSSDSDSDAEALRLRAGIRQDVPHSREEAQSRRFHRGRRSAVLCP